MGFRGKSKRWLRKKQTLGEILCENVPGCYLLSVFLLSASKLPTASPVLAVPGGPGRWLPTFVTQFLFIRRPALPVSYGKISIFLPPLEQKLNIKACNICTIYC